MKKILEIYERYGIYVSVFPVIDQIGLWKFELLTTNSEAPTLLIDNVSDECKQDMKDTWVFEEAVSIGVKRAGELIELHEL